MAYVGKSAKELKTFWPITSGLIAKTTKQTGRVTNLIYTDGTNISKKSRIGIR